MTPAILRSRNLPGDYYAAAVIERAERFGLNQWDANTESWAGLGHEHPDPTGLGRWYEDLQREKRRRAARERLASPEAIYTLNRRYETMS